MRHLGPTLVWHGADGAHPSLTCIFRGNRLGDSPVPGAFRSRTRNVLQADPNRGGRLCLLADVQSLPSFPVRGVAGIVSPRTLSLVDRRTRSFCSTTKDRRGRIWRTDSDGSGTTGPLSSKSRRFRPGPSPRARIGRGPSLRPGWKDTVTMVSNESPAHLDYAYRHLQFGWWSLLCFATLGLVLGMSTMNK